VPINQIKEKERKTKGKIRQKISPPLDPLVVSAVGRGPPVVGVRRKACPFSFYTLWVPLVPPQGRITVRKVLQMGWWAWEGLSGLTIPLCRVDLQASINV